jgi:peptidyl-prolyl cis-trans isomerase C
MIMKTTIATVFITIIAATLAPALVFAQATAANAATATNGAAAPVTITNPRVNGVTLNPVEVQQATKRLIAAGLKDTVETQELAKQEVIAREVFRQAALAQKLDQDPEVQQAMREARDGAMMIKFVQRNLQIQPVSEADVQAEFYRLIGNLGSSEFQAIVLQFPDVATAQLSAQQIAENKTSVEQLAQQYLRPGSLTASNELTWVSFKSPPTEGKTAGLPLAIANTLLALLPGDSSGLVADGNTVFMVKLQAMRPTVIPTLEKAKGAIRNLLEQKAKTRATQDLIGRLTGNAKVE